MRHGAVKGSSRCARASVGLLGGLSLLVAGWALQPWRSAAAEEQEYKPEYSTDPVDRDECRLRLSRIHEAIVEYQKDQKALPRWLSDLNPDYLKDPEVLVCPYVRRSGNVNKWREKFVVFPVFADPVLCTYGYELCLQPIENLPDETCRSFKQSQMALVGFGVPIVRCLAHRPVLNLAFDGSLYESDVFWENNFVRVPEDETVLHDVLLTLGRGENQPVPRLIRPRDSQAGPRLLDLSKQYNATLLHLSQFDLSGKLLPTFPEGLTTIGGVKYDVRGVVHLTGRNFPIPFPDRVDGIAVGRKCAQVHFLYGAVFSAAPGTPIANWVVQYRDGRTNAVPLVYGEDVKTRWSDAGPAADSDKPTPAWTSPPDLAGPRRRSLRLYHTAWRNPHPELEINQIGFVSRRTEAAPFLVAVTLE